MTPCLYLLIMSLVGPAGDPIIVQPVLFLVNWQDEDLLFDTGVPDGDKVIVDVTTGKKQEQSVKVDEMEVSTAYPVTTAGEVVTTASEAVTTIGVEDSDAPTIPVTTATTTPHISKDELTLAQTLIEIKAAKPKAVITAATTTTHIRPKARGVVVQEPSQFRTTTSPSQAS
ncbi:hypothetical protein Tco_0632390 [Tanacetum coccineum]